MIPIFDAGWQLAKVRAVMIGSLLALVACLYFGIQLIQTYGLSPGDGGELASLPARLAIGSLVISLGGAFALGMWLFGRQYAARMGYNPDTKQIHLHTVGFLWDGHQVLLLGDIGKAQYHADLDWGGVDRLVETMSGRGPHGVDAPWTSVRIQGWRWPLIIDQQGNMLHAELMHALFGVAGE